MLNLSMGQRQATYRPTDMKKTGGKKAKKREPDVSREQVVAWLSTRNLASAKASASEAARSSTGLDQEVEIARVIQRAKVEEIQNDCKVQKERTRPGLQTRTLGNLVICNGKTGQVADVVEMMGVVSPMVGVPLFTPTCFRVGQDRALCSRKGNSCAWILFSRISTGTAGSRR